MFVLISRTAVSNFPASFPFRSFHCRPHKLILAHPPFFSPVCEFSLPSKDFRTTSPPLLHFFFFHFAGSLRSSLLSTPNPFDSNCAFTSSESFSTTLLRDVRRERHAEFFFPTSPLPPLSSLIIAFVVKRVFFLDFESARRCQRFSFPFPITVKFPFSDIHLLPVSSRLSVGPILLVVGGHCFPLILLTFTVVTRKVTVLSDF